MRFSVRSVCAHRSFKNYYSPESKHYTLTQDRLTDSLVLDGKTPFESVPGEVQMEYVAGEKWGVKALAHLSDRNASYPEVIIKWSWSEVPVGRLVFMVEYQVTLGTQPNPAQVQVQILDEKGNELVLRKKKTDWKHLDAEQTKVGVMVFAVADPVPVATDAGVLIRALDATTFTSYRTAWWTAAVRIESVSMETMTGEKVVHLAQMGELIEESSELAIGLSASRANSLSSSIDYPDLATLNDLE